MDTEEIGLIQAIGIKRTIGSFIQKWGVEHERLRGFEFTFNDFGDKRTIRRILKGSFVEYKRVKLCALDSKPGLDKRTNGRIITS